METDTTTSPATGSGQRRARRRSERAEGVISTAIAVLIVAFLGIALWTGFDAMMNSATERTRTQVEQIGG
jgi:type IV secretory pathway VirB2 component (pilin)